MTQRAIVFVGSVGTGKSTLINKLREVKDDDEENAARVGHRDDEDGTETITEYQDTVDPDLLLIDTPGLDSANFSAHVVEKVQNLNRKLMIVLVTSKRNVRITCKTKFEQIMRDLFNPSAQFCSIQTFSTLPIEEFSGYLENISYVQVHKDSDLKSFRETFSNPEMFHTPKAIVAAVKAAEAVANRVAQPQKMKAVVASPKVKAPREFPLGIPPFLNQKDAFKNRQPKQQGKFEDLCNEVVALKKEGSFEWQSSKLLGDSHLQSTVYSLIKKLNGNEKIKTTAEPILKNDGAMALFFDKHLAAKHDKALPNEKITIDNHGISDVVEALLELARSKGDTFAFMFIIEELFVLAEKGFIIGK